MAKVTVPLPFSQAAMAGICAGSEIKQVAVRIISPQTSSPSNCVRLPGLPGTLVWVLRSSGMVMGGCSVT